MKMFLGEYQPNITEGARIALPKKLRDQILGDDIVLSRGFEKCIFVFDKADWYEESKKQLENSITDVRSRELKRYMFASAHESSIDAQGRIVLPQSLKEYAALGKKAVVIGAGDHIEVWDHETWQTYLAQLSEELSAQRN